MDRLGALDEELTTARIARLEAEVTRLTTLLGTIRRLTSGAVAASDAILLGRIAEAVAGQDPGPSPDDPEIEHLGLGVEIEGDG